MNDRIRAEIYARDGCICQYCGATDAPDYDIDHVVPRAAGGSNDPKNLVVACFYCNSRKGNQTWIPRNFAAITAGDPEWAAAVQASATPPAFVRNDYWNRVHKTIWPHVQELAHKWGMTEAAVLEAAIMDYRDRLPAEAATLRAKAMPPRPRGSEEDYELVTIRRTYGYYVWQWARQLGVLGSAMLEAVLIEYLGRHAQDDEGPKWLKG